MNYLYNGVELPALPEWDKEAYPYAAIGRVVYSNSVGDWKLIASDTPFTATVTNGHISFMMSAPVMYDNPADQPNEWVSTETGFYSTLEYLWSNHDMYDYNDSTVLVHKASTPISLEGMKVIEWDGDPSGLAELDPGGLWKLYRVGDSLTDLSSIGALVVGQGVESFVIPDAQLALDETLGMFAVASEVMGSVIGFAEVILNVTVDTDGIPEGLYFASVPADVLETGGSGHISLFAYTPTPKTILSIDHTALTQGWIVGKRLAAMRAKRKPVAYLYRG